MATISMISPVPPARIRSRLEVAHPVGLAHTCAVAPIGHIHETLLQFHADDIVPPQSSQSRCANAVERV